MKTKTFLSILVGLLVSVSLFADDPETTTFSNTQATANGSIKEFTTFKSNTSEPLQRSIYRYDLSGNIQEKTIYSWNGKKGWIGRQKLEYAYDTQGSDKPSTLIYTKWDNRTNDWSSKAEKISYKQNDNGALSISKTYEIDNNENITYTPN